MKQCARSGLGSWNNLIDLIHDNWCPKLFSPDLSSVDHYVSLFSFHYVRPIGADWLRS